MPPPLLTVQKNRIQYHVTYDLTVNHIAALERVNIGAIYRIINNLPAFDDYTTPR